MASPKYAWLRDSQGHCQTPSSMFGPVRLRHSISRNYLNTSEEWSFGTTFAEIEHFHERSQTFFLQSRSALGSSQTWVPTQPHISGTSAEYLSPSISFCVLSSQAIPMQLGAVSLSLI